MKPTRTCAANVVVVSSLVLLYVALVTGCSDSRQECGMWARRGQCYQNRAYMHVHCPDTCGLCAVQDPHCTDKNAFCPGWADMGECENNYKYMRKTCSRSCAFCQPANNHNIPYLNSNVVDIYWQKWNRQFPHLAQLNH
ncbi:uncharacterized protein LOC143028491 [Oratosquilla oratoria]|uniref:uncharacterized protein LOC143028491 n=1 Tax=Oratosquilla oratoria TaxID=337810 RepID=UPI003F76164B